MSESHVVVILGRSAGRWSPQAATGSGTSWPVRGPVLAPLM